MNGNYSRGLEWRKWDLQFQTILDDNYISIASCFDELKNKESEKINKKIEEVWGE